MRVACLTLSGLLALATAACSTDGLSDAERAWCAENHPTVLATMDVLYPYHWEGNESYKAEALPVFRRVEEGTVTQQEANLLLAEMAQRYWPEEYEQGCRAAYREREGPAT